MNMDTIVFGTYTLQHLLIAGSVALGLLILIGIVKSIFKKEKVNPHTQTARCGSCGWQGQVSRYAGRCPKCNEPLGEQKVRKIEK